MSVRAAVAIVAAVVVTEGVLVLFDAEPDLILVAAIVTAIGVSIWAARPLVADAPRLADLAAPADLPDPSTPDLRTAVLRQALGGGGSSRHHAERIREQLIAIVDDQLLVAHGIDRAADPAGAQRLLGPDVARLVADPSSVDRLNQRRLRRLLTQIETL